MLLHAGHLELNVVVDGPDTGPSILLLHGITMSTATWSWLVPDLTDRYRVLRLDFRGHGGSARAPGAYDYPGYVSDALAVVDQIAVEPVIVIGHSLGGGTALALAQQHPSRVRALVLEDPPLAPPAALADNTLLDGFRMLRESIPHLQQSGIPHEVLVETLRAAPSAAGPTFGELLHDDALHAMATSLLQLDVAVLDPVLEATIAPAYDPDRPITVPILLLTADPNSPDAVTHPRDAERLRTTSPAVQVHALDGASHLIHDERAHRDTFRRSVLSFLERLPAA